MKNSYTSSYKIISIVILSAITATGMIPFGYNFSHLLKPYTPLAITMLIGVMLGASAYLGNMGLAIYSFLNLNLKHPINTVYLALFSLFSAIPTGFIFYFAYQNILNFTIAMIGALIVFIINAGINYVAFVNLFLELKNRKAKMKTYDETAARLLGLTIGLTVTLTFYMATINGLSNLLPFNIACLFALFAWMPGAALFSNSTQIIAAEIYHAILHFQQNIKKLTLTDALIILIALGAGAAFSEMAIEFFDPERTIPTIFKSKSFATFMSILIYIPAFAVNYLALRNLIAKIR